VTPSLRFVTNDRVEWEATNKKVIAPHRTHSCNPDGAWLRAVLRLRMRPEATCTDHSGDGMTRVVRPPGPVCTENLNPVLAVMEPAQDGKQCDAPGPLNQARDRAHLYPKIDAF
jgi:hypothetical protein